MTEFMLRKFADDTKLGKRAYTPDVFVTLQINLDWLEIWADGLLMNVQKRELQTSNHDGEQPHAPLQTRD